MKVYDHMWGLETDLVYRDFNEYGDIMTIEEFLEDVELGALMDYDGHGFLANESQETNIMVKPSNVDIVLAKYNDKLNLQFVVWYDR